MKRRYLVVYEKGKRNYSGFVPDVPGCVSTGKTLEAMRSHLAEALSFHLEGIAEDGEQIPEASTISYPVIFDNTAQDVLGYTVEWLNVPLPKQKAQTRRRLMKVAA